MSEFAIQVEDLSKQYWLTSANFRSDGLRHRLENLARTPFRWFRRARLGGPATATPAAPVREGDFWALRGVSFQVRRGDALGVIGRNGAGKSTLLKILSRITEPTSGRVRLRGRVASLLEVGTGFHPELTGRENIFLNGAILGMTRYEIRAKFDEIVAFAELSRFIDTPVKRYSSGMYVRLAFAVAAHLEPEILLLDEVLAVGDAEFQQRCAAKMRAVSRAGKTVILVSHNMAAIRDLCGQCLLLDAGTVVASGDRELIIKRYLTEKTECHGRWDAPAGWDAGKEAFFVEVRFRNQEGIVTGHYRSTEPCTVCLRLSVSQLLEGVQVAVRLMNQEGISILTTTNCDVSHRLERLAPGRHEFHFVIPANFLIPDRYHLIAALVRPNQQVFDVIESGLALQIEDFGTQSTILRDGRLGVVAPTWPWDHRFNP